MTQHPASIAPPCRPKPAVHPAPPFPIAAPRRRSPGAPFRRCKSLSPARRPARSSRALASRPCQTPAAPRQNAIPLSANGPDQSRHRSPPAIWPPATGPLCVRQVPPAQPDRGTSAAPRSPKPANPGPCPRQRRPSRRCATGRAPLPRPAARPIAHPAGTAAPIPPGFPQVPGQRPPDHSTPPCRRSFQCGQPVQLPAPRPTRPAPCDPARASSPSASAAASAATQPPSQCRGKVGRSRPGPATRPGRSAWHDPACIFCPEISRGEAQPGGSAPLAGRHPRRPRDRRTPFTPHPRRYRLSCPTRRPPPAPASACPSPPAGHRRQRVSDDRLPSPPHQPARSVPRSPRPRRTAWKPWTKARLPPPRR